MKNLEYKLLVLHEGGGIDNGNYTEECVVVLLDGKIIGGRWYTSAIFDMCPACGAYRNPCECGGYFLPPFNLSRADLEDASPHPPIYKPIPALDLVPIAKKLRRVPWLKVRNRGLYLEAECLGEKTVVYGTNDDAIYEGGYKYLVRWATFCPLPLGITSARPVGNEIALKILVADVARFVGFRVYEAEVRVVTPSADWSKAIAQDSTLVDAIDFAVKKVVEERGIKIE